MEVMSRFIFFAFIFINIAFCIYFTAVQIIWKCEKLDQKNGIYKEQGFCRFTLNLRLAYFIFILLVVFTLFVSQFFIYNMLVKALRTNLNVMYEKKKQDLRLILIIGLISTSVFVVFQSIIDLEFREQTLYYVNYTKDYKKMNIVTFYALLFLYTVYKLPYYLYAIVTIRNIDFKLYLCYIYLSHNMIESIKGSSIFLVGKPRITYDRVSISDQSSGSLEFDISFMKRMAESVHVDYSTDNELENEKKLAYSDNIAKSLSFVK